MRETRFIANGRCCHLISRVAHQAFFLDDDEKTRAVELLRRVEEFSGVIVLAYAIMSNHFHFFIYVPEPESKLLGRARPTEKYVSRFGEYRKSFLRRMWNSSGEGFTDPLRPPLPGDGARHAPG